MNPVYLVMFETIVPLVGERKFITFNEKVFKVLKVAEHYRDQLNGELNEDTIGKYKIFEVGKEVE